MATETEAETDYRALQRRIGAVRKHLGMTQKAFAGELGVSRSYLSQVEAGKSKPSIEMVIGIAAVFSKINSDWLLTGQQRMERADASGEQPLPTGIDVEALRVAIQMLERYEKMVAPKRRAASSLDVAVARAIGNRDAAPRLTLKVRSEVCAVVYRRYMRALAFALGQGEPEDRARRNGELRSLATLDALIKRTERQTTPVYTKRAGGEPGKTGAVSVGLDAVVIVPGDEDLPLDERQLPRKRSRRSRSVKGPQ